MKACKVKKVGIAALVLGIVATIFSIATFAFVRMWKVTNAVIPHSWNVLTKFNLFSGHNCYQAAQAAGIGIVMVMVLLGVFLFVLSFVGSKKNPVRKVSLAALSLLIVALAILGPAVASVDIFGKALMLVIEKGEVLGFIALVCAVLAILTTLALIVLTIIAVAMAAKREETKVVAQPAVAPAPVAEPAPAPAPVVAEPVKEEPVQDKKKFVRISFAERLIKSEKSVKENYNEIKNELLAYGLKSRVSFGCDTFRLHREAYAKITVAGKGLKIYFALRPRDYKDSPIPTQDVSKKAVYADTPLAFKVKSDLSVRRAKQLIADMFAKNTEVVRKEPENTNWAKELKNY